MKILYLSKYRTQLMGVAAFFIILCHTSFLFSGTIDTLYNIFVRQLMQCGVDVFLLLSGIGCYFSYNRQPSILRFYKKRMLRIFIPYLIIVIVWGGLRVVLIKENIANYLFEHSLVSFYSHGVLKSWFVGGIIVLYALFPLIYKLLNWKSNSVLYFAVIIIIFVLLPIWHNASHSLLIVREVFFTRIPVFLVGSWTGKMIYERHERRINPIIFISVFLVFIFIFLLNVRFNVIDTLVVSRLLFLPISVSLCVLLSNLFFKIHLEQIHVNRTLLMLGTLSFELYLCFEEVLFFITVFLPRPRFITQYLSDTVISVIINLFSIVITLLLAFFLHKISNIIVKLLQKSKG